MTKRVSLAAAIAVSGMSLVLAFSKAEDPVAISAEEKDLTRKSGIFSWSGRG